MEYIDGLNSSGGIWPGPLCISSYKRFDCLASDIEQQLENHGVAVVQIFSPSECENFRNRAWADFSRLINLQKDDPNTYKNLKALSPIRSMLLKNNPLVHLQWVWDIRQDPRIVEIFASLWNTNKEDLLVSYDAISLHLPSEITYDGWFNNRLWIHTDQSSEKKFKCCVQGLVNLYPVNPGDATLLVLEDSHKYFNEYFEYVGIANRKDFIIIEKQGIEFFLRKGCVPRWVLADEGTLVLWDSRVFHMGSGPIIGREKQNFRLVTYVCMLPRHGVSQKILDKKLKALENKVDTSHWANCAYVGRKHKPGYFPFTFNDIQDPQLSPLGRRLAGFNN
ncbi:hypothetical protein SteCoe_32361 [Stentor coeruleus]|uniref:Phytanoyl-CoA dioxygenase n=1 Tax=Stentor coeruleus TaxID=5963 RepID=A0A1R2AZL3_9CILI|nr:hypothetical protein SteCoe_32361 [Stentor coeruleus]